MESDNPRSVKRLQELVDSKAQAELRVPSVQRQLDITTEDWEAQLKSEQVKRIVAENANYRQDAEFESQILRFA